MINYANLKSVIDKLDNNIPILIAGHKNADYDSICSCLALTCLLNKLGKKAYTLLEKCEMDKTYWLDTKYIIHNYYGKDYNFILLDANRKSRLGIYEPYFDNAQIRINIDHHEGGLNEAEHIFISENISSSCELLYSLMLEYNNIFDKELATLLYSGIASDTNSFYKRTTPQTMKCASHLLEYGIDASYVIKHTCKTLTIKEANLLADMINNIMYNGFHYIVLNRKNKLYADIPYSTIFKKCASYIYEISDIKLFGLFLIELDGSISGLLRSNCDIDVDIIAKKFGGGGHKKASGFENNMNINDILDDIENYIIKR